MIVVGNSGVGKSSIVSRFVESDFYVGTTGTMGINFKNKTIEIDNKPVDLQIWDTAGQERFWSITPAYCRKADGVILIYDITNSKTFDSILFWKNKVLEYSPEGVEIMLMGNKLDLRNERVISEDAGKEAARRMSTPYYEVSALTGQKIEQALGVLAKAILDKKVVSTSEESRCFPYRIPIEDEIISIGNEDDDQTKPTKGKSPFCCASTPK